MTVPVEIAGADRGRRLMSSLLLASEPPSRPTTWPPPSLWPRSACRRLKRTPAIGRALAEPALVCR